MADYEFGELPLEELLLDPNNYRFQDLDDFQPALETRFHEENVQSRASERLRKDGLSELRSSILKNGYLPVERIIVRSYEHEADRYVVLEGNRRVAALRWLRDDHAAGVDIPAQLIESLESLPVLKATSLDGTDFLALMGIRHVSGVKRWGGYQEAKLVFDLRGQGLDASEIGDRLAMHVREVNRRLRAFRSLRQMQDDEEFTGSAHPDLYAIFHEAVSIPALRDWVGWNDADDVFEEGAALHSFYGLISEAEGDDGATVPPKITKFSDVRSLRPIIADDSARAALFDPTKTLTDAAALAEQDRLTASWRSQVAEALRAVANLPWTVVRDLESEELELIRELEEKLGATIATHEKLA